jgi:uncharacterized protein
MKRIVNSVPKEPSSTIAGARVRASGVHGLGLFGIRAIAAGRRIGVYEGRRYSVKQAKRRKWNHVLTYVFALSDGTLIDGGKGGNATRHINHSCQPNCMAYEIEDDDGKAIIIIIEAGRAIRRGEELFLDYALEVGDEDRSNYACVCGARQCRGSFVAP